jgi:hypothetical protein
MNRRNQFHPNEAVDPRRHLPPPDVAASSDGRYAYRESTAPRYGQPPPAVDPYGVGLSRPQGGYVDRPAQRMDSGDSYQRVRPWGPQEGVDRDVADRGGPSAFGEREWRETRHDAVVGGADHGLGPDIAPTRDQRGRGPKNYQRSDERLKEDISERLRDDPRIDASGITVDVTGGRVSLSGEVDSRRTKHQVEDLVDACRGVQDIDNRLRLRESGRNSGQ